MHLSRRYRGLFLFLVWLFAFPALMQRAQAASAPAPSFARDVLPILRTACVGCHSIETPAGGLALANYTTLMKGGKNGAEIVPGKSADSRLVKLLLGAQQPKMPPGGPLKPADIDKIRQWIDAGAKSDALPETGHGPDAHAVAAASKLTVVHPLGKLLSVPSPVTALAFSPDGTLLAVGAYRCVQFWEVATHRVVGTWPNHADAVHALAFSKDGHLLAAGGGAPGINGEIRIWDTRQNREVAAFGDHTDVVNGLAFSPDGTKIASASADKSVRIWETLSGKSLAVLREHSDAVWSVAWSPDGKYLASASSDWSVKVWDANSGKRLYSVPAHDGIVYDVEFSPDGKHLLTSSGDNTAKVWNFGPDNSNIARSLTSHTHPVLAAVYSAKGEFAATASADKSIKLWTLSNGSNTATLTDAKDWIYAVRFSPDGKHLAGGAWDGTILLWSLPDGKLEGTFSTLPSLGFHPAAIPQSPPKPQ